MSYTQIWINGYLHPTQAMDAVARLKTPKFGVLCVILRGLLLSVFLYMPFYLLGFEPITPAYLSIFDTPYYFLYAAAFWPVFNLLSLIFLQGVAYTVLRILGYPANFDQMLNLAGLLDLIIGIVLLAFDWMMVAIDRHENMILLGLAHILISDPWSIALTAAFFKKYFHVPVGVSILLGILLRLLFIPIAAVLIRT